MINLNRRGSVLVHVLITGVIVALIAAGLLRMVLMNYIVIDRASKGAGNRKESEAMLNRVVTYWSQNGVCSNFSGFACNAAASPCVCTGSPLGGSLTNPTITVAGAAPGPYTINLNSSDPP